MARVGSSKAVSHGGTDFFLRTYGPEGPPRATIIALHGFTGSGEDWGPLMDAADPDLRWICPDLPGHGKTTCPSLSDYFRADRIASFLLALRHEQLAPVHLIGYSMGGRLALHFLRHFGPLPTLVIGANPGLDDPLEREARTRQDDHRLTAHTSLEAFCDAWEQLPLIAPQRSLPEPLRSEIHSRRRANDLSGLRLALRTLSPGRLPSLWPALATIPPFTFVHGEQDSAYAAIGARIGSLNRNCQILPVAGTGHAPHLETPPAMAAILDKWIG
jgi:2-succinyl-6-hydroxy-2,4-cyclohexadiene-1-carboxylate synthase